jgi:Flp pilus assembly protein TadD
MIVILGAGAFAVGTLGVCAQIQQNVRVDVLGQVYGPGGGSIPHSIRLHFADDKALRPPEIIFTDSNGRFVIYGLNQGENYSLTVDANEPFWGQTTVRFTPLGRRPAVQVYLNPYKSPKPEHDSASISAAALRAHIPRKARQQFSAGVEEVAKENYAKARRRFENAVAAYPGFVEARNELAVVLMKQGDLAGAELQLRSALESDGAAVMPLMNLGLCLYRQQRYGEAGRPLERAVQLQPENYRAHLLLGMTWVMAGDDPRAEAALLRAYALGGARAARAQFYLSHYYTRRQGYAQAARALEIYLHDVPADPNAAELQRTLERLRLTLVKN